MGPGEEDASPRSAPTGRTTASIAVLALALAGVALFAMSAGSIEAARDRSSQFDRTAVVRGVIAGVSAAAPIAEGEEIYLATCETCHGAGGAAAPSIKTVPLENATSVNAPDPRNAIQREFPFTLRRVKAGIGV